MLENRGYICEFLLKINYKHLLLFKGQNVYFNVLFEKLQLKKN